MAAVTTIGSDNTIGKKFCVVDIHSAAKGRSLCLLKFSIEHLSGKEAVELAREREKKT